MAGFKGHLRGGIVCAVIATGTVVAHDIGGNAISSIFVASGGAIVGSLLPDIDHPQSFLGRRLKWVSKPINHLWGHRSITHSLVLIGGIMGILAFIDQKALALGLGIGMLGHVIIDLCCRGAGVAFLYPFYPKRIQLFDSKKYKKWKRKLRKIF